ncbi:MAG: cyclic nucleotide-binding domain-containing protein, partial [Acidimicrobiia bacterium]|nr:cyclic nucleotide-binding domain-containing protein [Acidimicrobiia bacterium]
MSGRQLSTSTEELRGLFLFEGLTDEQLDWLLDHGTVESYDAGSVVYEQGDPAECFFVMLDGQVQLEKKLDGTDVVLTSSDLPGSYAGATRAFIPGSQDEAYASSLRVVTATRLFRLRAEDFAYVLKTWFPMAVHLLDGIFLGLTNTERLVGQREKLIALGALSAGLAHELNNPASAEVRAADALGGRLQEARKAIIRFASVLDGEHLKQLLAIATETFERARTAAPLSALDAGDLEDALGQRLEDAGVDGAWEAAPVFAGAGLDE